MSRGLVLRLILCTTAFPAYRTVPCVSHMREDAELSLSFRFCFSLYMENVTKSEIYNSCRVP